MTEAIPSNLDGDRSEQAEQGGRLRPLRIASRLLRLTLILLLIFAGWTTARGVVALFSDEPAAVSSTDTGDIDEPPLPKAWQSMPAEGYWTFAGTRWSVGVLQVGAHELAKRYAELGKRSAANAADGVDKSGKFLGALKRLPVTVRREPCQTTYHLNSAGLQMHAVSSRRESAERLLGFALAIQVDKDRWSLFEFHRPLRSVRESSQASDEHLLPLPQSAERVCCRRSRNGDVLLEFINLPADSGAMTARWTAAGWKLRKAGLGSSQDFSYLCTKGNRTIYAWSAPGNGRGRTLILVRSDGM